jgi:archaellum biogenesis protein FlaJ (TadC family)
MVRRRYVILLIVTELLLITLVIISSSLIHNYVVTVVGVGVLLTLGFLYMAFLMKGVRGVRLNLTYVAATLHMYCIATGEAGPKDLVGVVADTMQYGFLSSVFRRVRLLAERFGYGYTNATALVAQSTKPPLRDFLMRCTEAFSSKRPKDYLEIEVTTAMEEYSGMFTRALESMRLMGGIFITFQSATVFIIMTLAILTMLLTDASVVYVAYGISILSLITLFIGFRSITPKEPFFYKGAEPPRTYKVFIFALALSPLFIVPSLAVYIVAGPALAFTVLGVGMLIPGIFAYRLESSVGRIESYYPTFIKAVSEHLISVTDLKSVFSYVLYMELGPLRGLVNRALNRLRLNIGAEEVIDLLSSETGSYIIFISNRVFLDAFRRGGDLAEVGKKLSNFVVKVLELRKTRLSTAKSFEIMTVIMQPLIVTMLILMTSLLKFFSAALINLPFFTFGEVPISFIELGNVVNVIILTVLNALAVGSARGGFWGTILMYSGVLMILSAGSWFLTERLITPYISEMFGTVQWIPT